MIEFWKFFQHASAGGTKSTVVTPIQWLTSILGATLLGCIQIAPTSWITALVACLFAATILFYFWAYRFFAQRAPDSLRSERYGIEKLNIERSLKGDDIAGVRLIDEPQGMNSSRPEIPEAKPGGLIDVEKSTQ